ncbi:MAG: hypothetical protein JRJ00_00330 [Deltaproteobacteria bacterium]|nr:hypothetical protein [Deltaproteobacteria bacterium]
MKRIIMALLLLGLISCKTTYYPPVIIAPVIDPAPTKPDYMFTQEDGYLTIPNDDAIKLGEYIIDLKAHNKILQAGLDYYKEQIDSLE